MALLLACTSVPPGYRPAAGASPRQSQLIQADPDVLVSQFRLTGSPVPSAWQPQWGGQSATGERPSVAKLAEEQAAPDAMITYVNPSLVFEFAARFSRHSKDPTASFHAVAADKEGMPKGKAKARVLRSRMSYSGNPRGDSQPKEEEQVDLEGPGLTGISRCGFSWDDAAAKMGKACTTKASCQTPKKTSWSNRSYWYKQNYTCFTDLPNLNDMTGNGTRRNCLATNEQATDDWCQEVCNSEGAYCDPQICDCDGIAWATAEVFNTSAPIQPHVSNISAEALPPRSIKLVRAVKEQAELQPSGLPDCTWRPPQGCSNVSQYECIEGANNGVCSGQNWFDRPKSECSASCVHVVLLRPAPYYALWYPGPLAKEPKSDDEQPRYKHAVQRFSLRARGLDLSKSDIMMSGICQSNDNQFVGISMYSPTYKEKATRLLRSCSRVGVCCKARELPSNAFGPDAPEGSEAFRFETIASKPSFILGELDNTHLPVVFLDTDLEFHRFPSLFVPGSWPNGPRDVAIYNFWGNETDLEHALTPTTGSGVVFFNQTRRARSVLTAWAEAMAWEGNTKAPDDQVLDVLLKDGGWLARASFGYLPSSYLRNMPAYYRGVVPVIDHDHGNMPGLAGHSMRKPVLPPVDHKENVMRVVRGEPAPLPRAPDHEPEATVPHHVLHEAKLPPGTCKATLTGLDDYEREHRWNPWCDENCGPDKWGTPALGGCQFGSETAVACVCKTDIKALRVQTDDAAPVGALVPSAEPEAGSAPAADGAEGAPEASEVAPSGDTWNDPETWTKAVDPKRRSFAAKVAPANVEAEAVPPGECRATNPSLQGGSKHGWSAWCAQTCLPPRGRLEHCAAPEMTGVAMCACAPAER